MIEHLWQHAITYPIDDTAVTSVTVVPAVPGKRFLVIDLEVATQVNNTVLFKSGTTALTGALDTTSKTVLSEKNNGVPVFCGRKLNEAFVIDLGSSDDINGFATVAFTDAEEFIPT